MLKIFYVQETWKIWSGSEMHYQKILNWKTTFRAGRLVSKEKASCWARRSPFMTIQSITTVAPSMWPVCWKSGTWCIARLSAAQVHRKRRTRQKNQCKSSMRKWRQSIEEVQLSPITWCKIVLTCPSHRKNCLEAWRNH